MTSSSQQTPPAQTLAGKVAIVTGASRGLGAGMAMELGRKGAKVAITYTSPNSTPKASALASEIKSLSSTIAPTADATTIQADLRDLSSPAEIVNRTLSAFQTTQIDILVNNAGVERDVDLSSVTAEDYASVFDVNVRGVVLLTSAVIPHLPPISKGGGGRIVNISSVGARASGFPRLSLYQGSKAAIEGFTRSWASELGRDNHTVNAVEPGPVESQMLDNVPVDIVEKQKAETPVGNRVGTVEEVASVVAWLGEEGSRWVSGQTISVSGGWLML